MGVADLPLALIVLGACAGSPPLPDDVVARVGAEDIPAERYFEALADLTVAERAPVLTAAHRRKVLDGLVDEALLRQRAQVLGLRDPSAAIDVDLGPAPPETEAELHAFWAAHPEDFARDPAWQVEALRFVGASAEGEARSAADRWAAGEAVEAPRLEVPAGPLPFGALEQYVGPTAARAARDLAPGEVAQPTRYASGWLVIRLVRVVPGEEAQFEAVRPAVVELADQAAAQARRTGYLASLRARTPVAVDAALRDAPIPADALLAAAHAEQGRQ